MERMNTHDMPDQAKQFIDFDLSNFPFCLCYLNSSFLPAAHTTPFISLPPFQLKTTATAYPLLQLLLRPQLVRVPTLLDTVLSVEIQLHVDSRHIHFFLRQLVARGGRRA